MSETEWKAVSENPAYMVSSDGEIKKVDGDAVGQWLNNQGYALVRLSNPRCMRRVHRLVATAFVPNPSNYDTVNHLNNDRSDNRSSNLEWCTQKQNLHYADQQGRMQRDHWAGKRSPNARLTDVQVLQIRREYAKGGISLERLGRRYGISKRAIGRIVKRETYVQV